MAWTTIRTVLDRKRNIGARTSIDSVIEAPTGEFDQPFYRIEVDDPAVLQRADTRITMELYQLVGTDWVRRNAATFIGAPGITQPPGIGVEPQFYGGTFRCVVTSDTNDAMSARLEVGFDDNASVRVR